MSIELKLSDQLNFSNLDLTSPNIVIKKVLDQLPLLTHGIILGEIKEYHGHTTSYKRTTAAFVDMLEFKGSEEVIDIQKDLGKQGEEIRKYECYLYTSCYEKYKYRMFFIKFGLANYPVLFTLEESISKSITSNSSYIIQCNTPEEVETLMVKILTSDKITGIMQELIRIHEANKEKPFEESFIDGSFF